MQRHGRGIPDLVGEEVIWHLRRAGHLAGTLQPEDQQVQHQAVVLNNEGGKLQAADHTVRVGVVHVLKRLGDVSYAYTHTYTHTYIVQNTDFIHETHTGDIQMHTHTHTHTYIHTLCLHRVARHSYTTSRTH